MSTLSPQPSTGRTPREPSPCTRAGHPPTPWSTPPSPSRRSELKSDILELDLKRENNNISTNKNNKNKVKDNQELLLNPPKRHENPTTPKPETKPKSKTKKTTITSKEINNKSEQQNKKQQQQKITTMLTPGRKTKEEPEKPLISKAKLIIQQFKAKQQQEESNNKQVPTLEDLKSRKQQEQKPIEDNKNKTTQEKQTGAIPKIKKETTNKTNNKDKNKQQQQLARQEETNRNKYEIKVTIAEPKLKVKTETTTTTKGETNNKHEERKTTKPNPTKTTTSKKNNKTELTKTAKGKVITDLKKFLETKRLERAEKLKLKRETNLEFFQDLSTNPTPQPDLSAPITRRREPSTYQTKLKRESTALPRDLPDLCGILPLARDENRSDSEPTTDSVLN